MLDFLKNLFVSPPEILRGKAPWFIICVSIVGMLYFSINNGFTKFLIAIPFAVLFIRQIHYVKKKIAWTIFVVAVGLCVHLSWDLPHSKLLYPVLGEKVGLQGDWIAVPERSSGHDGLWLESVDVLEKEYCDKLHTVPDYVIPPPTPRPCRSKQEIKESLQKLYREPIIQLPSQFSLGIERVDTEWNEGSGTILLVYFTDSKGEQYYIDEQALMKAVKDGFVMSDVLVKREKDGTARCWGVQSCWSK